MDAETRFFFYDVFFSMFVREPTGEIIDAWRKGLGAIHEAGPDDSLGKPAGKLLEILTCENATWKVCEEYQRLFWLPDMHLVSLLASQYVDGKPFGKYLVRIREFIEKLPFRKCDDYAEPEDSLAFHLDLMRQMVREENEASCLQAKSQWSALQNELVNGCMDQWVEKFLDQLDGREDQLFYAQVAIMLRAYFEIERETLLEKHGSN